MAVYVLENSSDSEINIIKNHVSTIYDIGFNSIEFSFKYDFLKDKDYNGYLKKCKVILDEIKKYNFKHVMLKINHLSNFQELKSNIYLESYRIFLRKVLSDFLEYNFTIISISNEGGYLTSSKYTDFWMKEIEYIRKCYSGLITMSPHLNEIRKIEFLDKLDIIGVNIYPSICYREDFKKMPFSKLFDNFALNGRFGYLKELTKKYNKPFFIIECGCQPYVDRLSSPGESSIPSSINNDAQTVYYKVALPTLELTNFINGYFIWEGNGTGSYDPFYKGREKTKKFIEDFMERINK